MFGSPERADEGGREFRHFQRRGKTKRRPVIELSAGPLSPVIIPISPC